MSDPTQQTSGPLAASDIYNLQKFLVVTATQFLVHGLYTTIVSIVLYMLCTRPISFVAARNILIAITTIMFACSTTTIALDLYGYVAQLPLLGYNPPDLRNMMVAVGISINCLTRVNYLISDAVVVWRAWVLWTNHVKVRFLLCICMFGSFVGVLIDKVFGALYDVDPIGNARFSPAGPRALIMSLPLFITNLVSTYLVARKVWEYRQELKKNLEAKKKTQIEKILIILTESGAIYCLIWIPFMYLGVSTDQKAIESMAYQIVAAVLPQISAIYPAIIILLVVLERTHLDSTISGTAFSTSVHFASNPRLGGTQNEHTRSIRNGLSASVQLTPQVDDEAEDAELGVVGGLNEKPLPVSPRVSLP
ncbi:hypothetical protein C8J56DRAFT_1027444 [Mycena floridula]|nr:hypothetical protein C8J56DRAFT_1027444 [Mycena floridula]